MATSERALTMACVLLAMVLALTTANAAAGGQAAAAPATGSISGVVISDDPSARPIARAAVTLRSAALLRPLQLLTDEAGRFAFTGLPAASFTVTATKPSYLALSYGQTTPGRGSGLPIALEAGQQRRDLRLVLPRGACHLRPRGRRPQPTGGERADSGHAVSDGERRTDADEPSAATGRRPMRAASIAPTGCRPATTSSAPIHPATSRRFRKTVDPEGAARAHVKSPRPKCSGRASRFRPEVAAVAPSSAHRWRPRRRRANRSPSVLLSIRRRRVRRTPRPSRSVEGKNARASTS